MITMTQTDSAPLEVRDSSGSDGDKRTYVRSTVAFPYGDIDDAVAVAKLVYLKWGGNLPVDALAAEFGQSAKSGAFRTKVSTAQIFGVVTNERGILRVTELGRRVADEATRPAAVVEAFKGVPLYQRLLTVYRGATLPRDTGIQAEMIAQGVSPKQVDRARQAFQRSAEAAGFFHLGRDRLVEPPLASPPTVGAVTMTAESGLKAAAPTFDSPSSEGLHPLLAGLMRELPAEGEDFPAYRRAAWLRLAESIFQIMFEDANGERAAGYPAHS